MSVIQDAITAVEGQQPEEHSAVWMVGEQLKDMIRGDEAAAALLLNALKKLAGINKKIRLISPTVISPLRSLKCDYLGNHNPRLHSDEVLVALSICAATNETAALAMQQLPLLAGCEAHSTVILPQVDSNIFRRLKVNVTCDAKYQSHKLYHKK